MVDIGSNTVRLVIYETLTRIPIPIFNERSDCRLALGLNETGKLNPSGVEEAMHNLRRFSFLSKSMNVEEISILATAAVREASDGEAFVSRIYKSIGVKVRVLSGDEEARLSGYGLLNGRPLIDGLVADIGGGSIDMVELNRGKFGQSYSLPLGHLRLREYSGDNGQEAKRIVSEALINQSWLSNIKGRNLFLVGGGCRALARVFLTQANYPLHVIDGYKTGSDDARQMCALITRMGTHSAWRITDISESRLSSLPFVAAIVSSLLNRCLAKKVVFSGFGMREGQLLKMLPKSVRDQDPLLAGCAAMAKRTGRFSLAGEEIFDWIDPLFPSNRGADRRLRMAACMLSDIGWTEHPDYRAEHSFHRVLRLPFAGLSHHNRAFLAFSLFFRYNGNSENSVVQPIISLLNGDELEGAAILGKALRLAYTLFGAAPSLLPMTQLKITDRELILSFKADGPAERELFTSELVERRLRILAEGLSLEGKLA